MTAPARPAEPFWPLVTIPGTQSRQLSANGIDYRIGIALPKGDPPARGFPVMYLLDANAGVSPRSWKPRGGWAAGPTRQGWGLPSSSASAMPRTSSTTPACASGTTPPAHLATGDGSGAGAEAFLAFIRGAAETGDRRDAAGRPERRILVGHSLAGYFVLWVLTRRTEAFQGYVAVSPSSGGRDLIAAIPAIRAPVSKSPDSRRGMGGGAGALASRSGERPGDRATAFQPQDGRQCTGVRGSPGCPYRDGTRAVRALPRRGPRIRLRHRHQPRHARHAQAPRLETA